MPSNASAWVVSSTDRSYNNTAWNLSCRPSQPAIHWPQLQHECSVWCLLHQVTVASSAASAILNLSERHMDSVKSGSLCVCMCWTITLPILVLRHRTIFYICILIACVCVCVHACKLVQVYVCACAHRCVYVRLSVVLLVQMGVW